MNRQRVRAAMTMAAVAGAVALVSGATGAVSASSPASTADPLGCSSDVFDPAGLLNSSVVADIDQTEQTLGADVRVRAERSVDGGLDSRIDQLVRQCDGWAAPDGELADDMVVVLFSVMEREASVYYGADVGPDLEDRWSDAIDAMTAEFPDSYADGVHAALRVLRTGPTQDAADDTTTSSSSAGPVFALLVIGVLIAAGVFSYVRREGWTGGTLSAWSSTDDDGDSGWSWSGGSSRARSRSSFFGSGSRSRSSGSRRSSGGGSRRAGGGTKKW